MATCQIAQKRIVSRAEAEIRFNIQRFDSGAGVEDVVREELGSLLPKRYSVDAGVVDESRGENGRRLRRIDSRSPVGAGHQAWRDGMVEASTFSDRRNLCGGGNQADVGIRRAREGYGEDGEGGEARTDRRIPMGTSPRITTCRTTTSRG